MDKTRIFLFRRRPTLPWVVWVSCCLFTTKWPCKMRNSQLFYVQVVNRKNCSSAHVQRNRMVLGLSSEEIESRFIQVFFSHKASWLFQCDCLTDINHVKCRLHYNYMSIAKIGQQSNSIEFLKVRTRDWCCMRFCFFGTHMNYYCML